MEITAGIDGEILRKMILYSKEEIQFKKDYLDAINVFPVPDGDTGMNMYLTINKIVTELEKVPSPPSVKTAAKSISKGAFLGSKGNSGVILSQFLIGLFKHLENKQVITPQDWAEGMKKGADKAYKAVVNPREGTILSVIKSTAATAEEIAQKENADWDVLFKSMYETAVKSTLETPEQMPLLKEKGVVDAGAQGFVYVLRGWLKAIGVKITEMEHEVKELFSNVTDKFLRKEKLTYQYCTEIILAPMNNVAPQQLHDLLTQYGDSIEIINHEGTYKIHIHTNEPQKVTKKLEAYGEPTLIKADDMFKQQEERNNKLTNFMKELEKQGYAGAQRIPN